MTYGPTISGLIAIEHLALGEHSDAAAVAALFDATLFEPSNFSREKIPYPPTISRSVAKRQAEFFFGRLAARVACAKCGCVAATIDAGPAREPVWPKGLIGSISHTNGLAVALVARDDPGTCGAGVDVEDVVQGEAFDSLLGMVVSEGEVDLLKEHTGALSLHVLITLAFSAKESFYKAAFNRVGRFFGFSATKIARLSTKLGEVELEVSENLCPAIWKGQRYTIYFKLLGAERVLTHAFLRFPECTGKEFTGVTP